jgi:hypothetical protein
MKMIRDILNVVCPRLSGWNDRSESFWPDSLRAIPDWPVNRPLRYDDCRTRTSTGMILVTNNEKEFARVQGLLVENWCAE